MGSMYLIFATAYFKKNTTKNSMLTTSIILIWKRNKTIAIKVKLKKNLPTCDLPLKFRGNRRGF